MSWHDFFGLEINEKQKVERKIWLLNQLDALEDKWDSDKSIKYIQSYAVRLTNTNIIDAFFSTNAKAIEIETQQQPYYAIK